DLPGGAQLAEMLADWKSVQVHQTALTLDNYLTEGTGYEGMYILVPRLEGRSWAQVRAFAQRLWDDPAAAVARSRTPRTVVKRSGADGVAAKLSTVLGRMGYVLRPPLPGTTRDASRLLDRTGGKVAPLFAALQKDLGATIPDEADRTGSDG